MGDINYKKEYLPGYTGHVPKKNDIFGCTAGDINRILTNKGYKSSNFDVDIAVNTNPTYAQRTFYSKPPSKDINGQEVQYGNYSKYGNNWIGGPTNNLKAQHIPGYQGYVPSIKSENIFGRSFAKATGNSINKEFSNGVELPAQERFKTLSNQEFNKTNFRRIKDTNEPANLKDMKDSNAFQDAEFQGIAIERPNIYLEMPTVGYQGFKSLYRPGTVSINHRKDPFFNINPLKSKLKEINVEATPQYQTMTDGFKRAAVSTKNSNFNPDQADIKVPVSGYTGHRMGYRSQNFYGKNYRDCTIQSKFIQKMLN